MWTFVIRYNFPERGPYEYDKFIISTFQLINKIKEQTKDFQEDQLISLKEEAMDLFNKELKRDRGTEIMLQYERMR